MNLLHSPFAPSVFAAALATVMLALLAWKSRHAFAYFRPFGTAESESLMNFSPLGRLECNCTPTDAAEPRNDRRRSCRSCGHAIISHDPARLYEPLSRAEIRRITRTLRRAGMDARKVALPATVTSLSELHAGSTLASLCAR